jgi:uncharacterized protein YoxC
METVFNICIIIVTIAIVSFIIMLFATLKDVRRMRIRSENFLDEMEQGINPIISEIKQIAEDVRQITYTARCQIEKVDSATDFINENVNSIVGSWIKTANLLHDAINEPVEDMAVFLKGFSKGFKFFFGNGRNVRNSG